MKNYVSKLNTCQKCCVAYECKCEEIKKCQRELGEPNVCRACGGTWFYTKVRAYVEYVIAEYEVNCMWCEEPVAYWAYGSFDPKYETPEYINLEEIQDDLRN